jgi:hypothetical protein
VLRDASFPVPFPDGKTIAFVPGARGFSGQSIAIAYVDGTTAWDSFGSVYVVEVSTGASMKVADGRTAEWLDDDTLIVNPESTPPNGPS